MTPPAQPQLVRPEGPPPEPGRSASLREPRPPAEEVSGLRLPFGGEHQLATCSEGQEETASGEGDSGQCQVVRRRAPHGQEGRCPGCGGFSRDRLSFVKPGFTACFGSHEMLTPSQKSITHKIHVLIFLSSCPSKSHDDRDPGGLAGPGAQRSF